MKAPELLNLLKHKTKNRILSSRGLRYVARQVEVSSLVHTQSPKLNNSLRHLEQYLSNGYVVVKSLIPRQEASEYCEMAMQLYHDHGVDILKKNIHSHVPWIHRVVFDPRIIGTAKFLLSDGPIPRSVFLFYKAERSRHSLPWHQDGHRASFGPDDGLRLWLALSASNKWNGSVQLLARSHRLGYLDHCAIRNQRESLVQNGTTTGISTPLLERQLKNVCQPELEPGTR